MKTTALVITFVIAILALPACGGDSEQAADATCSSADFEEAATLVTNGAIKDFERATKVADATSRISLAPIVRDLQGIADDLEAEAWPGCAASAQAAYREAMDATVEVYIAFMEDAGQATLTQRQTTSSLAWKAATAELLALDPEAE